MDPRFSHRFSKIFDQLQSAISFLILGRNRSVSKVKRRWHILTIIMLMMVVVRVRYERTNVVQDAKQQADHSASASQGREAFPLRRLPPRRDAKSFRAVGCPPAGPGFSNLLALPLRVSKTAVLESKCNLLEQYRISEPCLKSLCSVSLLQMCPSQLSHNSQGKCLDSIARK